MKIWELVKETGQWGAEEKVMVYEEVDIPAALQKATKHLEALGWVIVAGRTDEDGFEGAEIIAKQTTEGKTFTFHIERKY